MRQIHSSAWLLCLFSAGLQILIFPLPNLYMLCWVAITPLLVALLRARVPSTLQLNAGIKLLPAKPVQGFVLGYVCGIVWYAGSCYWIYPTMRQYGGLNAPTAFGTLILFSLYLAFYHGAFGLGVSLLAGESPFSRRALLISPFLWVAVELARTRISGFPWDLLGITQVDNVALVHVSRVTGVYGVSFEIMVVNAALAAAFLLARLRVGRERWRSLLLASVIAMAVLQTGRWINPEALIGDRTARLVQQNIPVLEGSEWTNEYSEGTLRDLTWLSLNLAGNQGGRVDLIVWPESPAPFYSTDPVFRGTLSSIARQSQAWVLAGSLGIRNASETPERATQVYNSGNLINPQGEWVARYDKVHLVPFGEYVPFKRVFGFAGGLTKEVGDFLPGGSRAPLVAGDAKLGVFICYESIFPDEIRQFVANGAQVIVNISNDGWYGDSGAYAQHLRQARMRAVENARWLLRDTNTGVTAVIDPYGRIVASAPRKMRTALEANYGLSNVTTFYTRHGDWFAYLCAIISVAALVMRFAIRRRAEN
ncbi:MAG: apolipoprotein N-acyltransferase [Acidobacteria bacterium]|nr:MAG: apolipoprotein N-acyltransferase [Acidobacteriota bacterium]